MLPGKPLICLTQSRVHLAGLFPLQALVSSVDTSNFSNKWPVLNVTKQTCVPLEACSYHHQYQYIDTNRTTRMYIYKVTCMQVRKGVSTVTCATYLYQKQYSQYFHCQCQMNGFFNESYLRSYHSKCVWSDLVQKCPSL